MAFSDELHDSQLGSGEIVRIDFVVKVSLESIWRADTFELITLLGFIFSEGEWNFLPNYNDSLRLSSLVLFCEIGNLSPTCTLPYKNKL